ncbi:hypothetical protein NUW54_g14544 [Trametes sanguinea]|uniref:Uncharacterized protein n=1 Tax=Trametes sanguinea TaxID=158606 RepID=A0ACC1MCE5_9APHY|nr:hypothetical protein NUW54_g14544 [Trametes sanguinea]
MPRLVLHGQMCSACVRGWTAAGVRGDILSLILLLLALARGISAAPSAPSTFICFSSFSSLLLFPFDPSAAPPT